MTTRELRDKLNKITDEDILDDNFYVWCTTCDDEYTVEEVCNRKNICYIITEKV